MNYSIRKSILFAAIFFGSVSGWCQISITSANMPSAGDTIRYSVVQNSTGFDFKTTGADKAWDFTTLKASSQDIYQYKNSTSTPYVLNFGFSALGLKLADSLGTGQMGLKDVYTFFKKSTAKWEAVGIGFQLSALPLPQAGKHTNSDEIYQFPLNYKDKDSATFALKVPLTAIVVSIGNYFQDGNRVNTVDGWGKISTPYQSNVECIRIKSVITESDSLAVQISGQAPINFAFPNNRVEYKWLSKTEKIPMLEVSGTEVGGSFTPTQVRFRDNYRVTNNPLAPKVDFVSDKLTAKTSETVTFTDKSTNNPQSYLWTITPGTYSFINGTSETSQNPQVYFSAKGTYTVKLTATNIAGSNSTTKTNYITINDGVGINTVQNSQLVAYPNPAKEKVTIEIPYFIKHSIKLFVFDMDGKNIENIEYFTNANSIELNTSKFATGRYTVIIKAENSIHYTTINILK